MKRGILFLFISLVLVFNAEFADSRVVLTDEPNWAPMATQEQYLRGNQRFWTPTLTLRPELLQFPGVKYYTWEIVEKIDYEQGLPDIEMTREVNNDQALREIPLLCTSPINNFLIPPVSDCK